MGQSVEEVRIEEVFGKYSHRSTSVEGSMRLEASTHRGSALWPGEQSHADRAAIGSDAGTNGGVWDAERAEKFKSTVHTCL